MARAQQQMARGELVSDATVLELIRERRRCLHCRGGFMLDGFPRTLAQATAIDDLLASEQVALDAVVSYELPEAEIVTRLSGRRVCPSCKTLFHVATHPPQTASVCDQCGGSLVQREDDRPEAIRIRLQAYHAATEPLAEYYRKMGVLISISAAGEPTDILARTLDALSARINGD